VVIGEKNSSFQVNRHIPEKVRRFRQPLRGCDAPLPRRGSSVGPRTTIVSAGAPEVANPLIASAHPTRRDVQLGFTSSIFSGN